MAKTAADLGIKAPSGGFSDNGWYEGYNYDAASGTFGDVRGQIWSKANPAAQGSMVSKEVNAQSAAEQGKTVPEFEAYLAGKSGSGKAAIPGTGSKAGAGTGAGSSGSGSAAAGGAKSAFNIQQEYDNLYKSLGVDTLKSAVDAKQAEIDQRRQRLAEAQGVINENPWYAEATRTGKLRKLEEQAQNDINNLTNEKTTLQSKVDSAMNELSTKTGLAKDQYTIDRQATQDAISELNSLLTSGADMSGINVADYAAKTGMSTETISALISAAEANEIKPTMIQSTDDNGNVTVSIIDANTGNLIGQKSLGSIGNKQGGSSAGSSASKAQNQSYISQFMYGNTNSYGHISPSAWNQALQAWVTDGVGSRDEFIKTFAPLTDPNRGDFEQNSGYGFSKVLRDTVLGGVSE